MSCFHVVPENEPEPAPVTRRPLRLAEIVGQPRLAQRLATHLNAAGARAVQPGHVFRDGAASLGKTTLAQAIAAEPADRSMTSTFHSVTADAAPRRASWSWSFPSSTTATCGSWTRFRSCGGLFRSPFARPWKTVHLGRW